MEIILNGYSPEQFKELFKESFKEMAAQFNSANAFPFVKNSSAFNALLPDNKDEVYLTRAQAADRLQISLPTLHQYTKDGLIISFRLGRKIRYKKSDIESALKERNFGKRRA